MARKAIVLIAAIAAMTAAAGTAAAAGITSSLFGGATQESSDVKLVSDLTDTSTANDFSGIAFTLPAGTTFADLKTLSTEFDPIAAVAAVARRASASRCRVARTCSCTSAVAELHRLLVEHVAVDGNLIGNNDIGRYDTSQVQAGTQSNTYAGALALVGTQTVTQIDLVADSGWFFNPKTQLARSQRRHQRSDVRDAVEQRRRQPREALPRRA